MRKYSEETETSESAETVGQTNIEKALALIHTFATGDTETARQLLDKNYIQHNLAYGTGEEALIGSVEYLAAAEAETTVNNIRAFEDGDYVFLQNVYNFAGALRSTGTTWRRWRQNPIPRDIRRLTEQPRLRIWIRQKRTGNWSRISCTM